MIIYTHELPMSDKCCDMQHPAQGCERAKLAAAGNRMIKICCSFLSFLYS